MKNTLTAEDLKEAMGLIKKIGPIYHYVVTKPSCFDSIPKVKEPAGAFDMFGVTVYIKEQAADAWMISDRDVLNKYMSGELSEWDLVFLAYQSQKVVPILP